METFFTNLIQWINGFFPYATTVHIVKGLIWSIMILLNGGFLVYLFFDGKKFSTDLKKDTANFEKEMKSMTKVFIDAQNKKVAKSIKDNDDKINKALEESTERINLLSKENGRLVEENDFLRDKLKNMGFGEEQLKP